jgi:hypothetical protein
MNDRRTRIDDAIDRAVRDLVRHDPPAGFRRRVLSRLDVPARRTLLWPGVVTAAAALALVTMTFVMRTEPRAPAPTLQHASTPEPAPPPALPAAPAPRDRASEPAAPPRGRRSPESQPLRMAVFGPPSGRVSAASVREGTAPAATAMEPVPEDLILPAPPPIAVGAIEPPPPLAIQPIVVVPIQIPRISPPR